MIIRSVRLKNIKSYRTGDKDEGITVEFEPGINRIAGRNGHGKSTLIEAIGYALFLAKPDYAETFKVETYLLRDGAKEGEIDVTFEHHGNIHRIERGVGKSSKRRTKVIDLADNSICAEGDKEVEKFLCQLLGVPSAKNLDEVFSKLVGVKQGRLTRPFDSKGAEARNFFEPLFDVAIFKECRDQLMPTKRKFDEQLHDVDRRKAGIDQKIAERSDSNEKLAQAEETIKQQQGEFETAIKERDSANIQKQKHEKLKEALTGAEKARNDAKNELQLTIGKLNTAKERLVESEKALATTKETLASHETYQDSDKQLKAMEKQRLERDALKEQWNNTENQRKGHKSDADNARAQAESFSQQQKNKSEELEKKNCEVAALDKKLSDSQHEYQEAEKAYTEVENLHSELQVWVSSLAGVNNRVSDGADTIVRLHKELSTWKPEVLKSADDADNKAKEELKSANTKLTETRERQTTLKAQLDQISGGVCPFLKETCKQFDPTKIQSDLSALAQEIAMAEKQVSEREKNASEKTQDLESLKKEQAQLKPKQETLDSESEDLLKELQSLFPKNISDAVSRLRTWDERIDSLPNPLSVPDVVKSKEVGDTAKSVAKFTDQAEVWRQCVEQVFEGRKETRDKVRNERARDEQALEQDKERKNELTTESKRLSEDAQTKLDEAKILDGKAADAQKQAEALDRQLKEFTSLDNDLKAQRERQDAHRNGHERYLQAKDLADALDDRKMAVTEAESTHKEANEKLKVEEQKFAEADKGFDSEELNKAVSNYEAKSIAVATMEQKLKHASEAKATEEKRFKEWEKACEELVKIEDEIRRLDASIEITELARKVLHHAAPTVAQHLCDRIAGRAQTVFNQINPDPIEVSWEAKQYSVRIVPGDRRFAMLSGGEQTKLALTLTLAMIEEFGGLSFCIFDEPTYGVDADSRQKLADVIIEAQSAAKLEQLLLVSHDDAFEGKIENVILLEKSAGTGSTVSKEE